MHGLSGRWIKFKADGATISSRSSGPTMDVSWLSADDWVRAVIGSSRQGRDRILCCFQQYDCELSSLVKGPWYLGL